jgi:hypothetical protein
MHDPGGVEVMIHNGHTVLVEKTPVPAAALPTTPTSRPGPK